jgi:hypothetical protein
MQVVWSSGKKGRVVEAEGERVVLRSEVAFAPGTPAAFSLQDPPTEGFLVKVHGCRREGAEFVITGRLVNLTRTLRALLEQGKQGDPAG